MDFKKVSNSLPGIAPNPAMDRGLNSGGGGVGGVSFDETLRGLGGASPQQSGIKKVETSGLTGIKFSNHAVERMQSRGIRFNPEDLGRLNDAVARAASKGSKNSLILMNDSALIVSVKNNTVVTVMDKNALKENVFTNIDSTIVM